MDLGARAESSNIPDASNDPPIAALMLVLGLITLYLFLEVYILIFYTTISV